MREMKGMGGKGVKKVAQKRTTMLLQSSHVQHCAKQDSPFFLERQHAVVLPALGNAARPPFDCPHPYSTAPEQPQSVCKPVEPGQMIAIQ